MMSLPPRPRLDKSKMPASMERHNGTDPSHHPMRRRRHPPSARLAQELPKQFAKLIGDYSLFQMTLQRFTGPEFAAPLVMTENEFRFMATEQCTQIRDARTLQPAGILWAPSFLDACLVHFHLFCFIVNWREHAVVCVLGCWVVKHLNVIELVLSCSVAMIGSSVNRAFICPSFRWAETTQI